MRETEDTRFAVGRAFLALKHRREKPGSEACAESGRYARGAGSERRKVTRPRAAAEVSHLEAGVVSQIGIEECELARRIGPVERVSRVAPTETH